MLVSHLKNMKIRDLAIYSLVIASSCYVLAFVYIMVMGFPDIKREIIQDYKNNVIVLEDLDAVKTLVSEQKGINEEAFVVKPLGHRKYNVLVENEIYIVRTDNKYTEIKTWLKKKTDSPNEDFEPLTEQWRK